MLLIDAIAVKIRDGQVANRRVYVAMGISLGGERDVLGMWVGPSGGEDSEATQNRLLLRSPLCASFPPIGSAGLPKIRVISEGAES